jgi:hypothetical protein
MFCQISCVNFLIISSLTLAATVFDTKLVTLIDYNTHTISSCGANYFDSTANACATCPTDKVIDPDFRDGSGNSYLCKCAPSFITVFNDCTTVTYNYLANWRKFTTIFDRTLLEHVFHKPASHVPVPKHHIWIALHACRAILLLRQECLWTEIALALQVRIYHTFISLSSSYLTLTFLLCIFFVMQAKFYEKWTTSGRN